MVCIINGHGGCIVCLIKGHVGCIVFNVGGMVYLRDTLEVWRTRI